MKNIKMYLMVIWVVIVGDLNGQLYSYKINNCGWFVMYNSQNEIMTFDNCFNDLNTVDCILTQPINSNYEFDYDSMVVKTNGVVTSKIIEIYQKKDYLVWFRFQFIGSEIPGVLALKRNADGRVVYCGYLIDDSKPYIEGSISNGDFKVIQRENN